MPQADLTSPASRSLADRLIVVGLAGVAMAMVARDLIGRGSPRPIPQATTASERPARIPTVADIEGETVSSEEADAGASWADSQALTRAADCPAYTLAFRAGCAQGVADRQPAP